VRGYKNFDSDPHPGDLRHMIEIGYTENQINQVQDFTEAVPRSGVILIGVFLQGDGPAFFCGVIL